MKSRKRISAVAWIVILIVILAVGAEVYFLLNAANSVPQPPVFP